MPSQKKVLRDGGQPSEENDTIFPQETGCQVATGNLIEA